MVEHVHGSTTMDGGGIYVGDINWVGKWQPWWPALSDIPNVQRKDYASVHIYGRKRKPISAT